jgi:hypothetical protein
MNDSDEFQLLAQVAEFHRTRQFGKYRGVVSDIADPESLGRVKAKVPAIFGNQEECPWAMPAVPFAGPQHGLVLLPEVGDGVWIEFEGGDLSRPIWSGCWWARDQRPEPQGDTIRLLATSSGHQVVLDESADEIKLVHPGGAEVTLGSSEISLKLGACEVKISATEVNINNGMVKVTTAGASLVNDAFKIGA